MIGLLVVVVTVGGSCAFVWSMIVQAEGQSSVVPRTGPQFPNAVASVGQPSGTFLRRVVVILSTIPRWVGAVREARRLRREQRILAAAGPQQVQFEEFATFGVAAADSVDLEEIDTWSNRPSRLVAALELIVLIVVVGGALAAATLGAARVVARIVAAHFAG